MPSRQRLSRPATHPNVRLSRSRLEHRLQAGTDLASGTWSRTCWRVEPPTADRRRPRLPPGTRLRADIHRQPFLDGTEAHPDHPMASRRCATPVVIGRRSRGPTGRRLYPNALERCKHQVAIAGLLAPHRPPDGRTPALVQLPHSRTRPSRSTSTAATPAWTRGARSHCSHSLHPQSAEATHKGIKRTNPQTRAGSAARRRRWSSSTRSPVRESAGVHDPGQVWVLLFT